MTSRSRWLLGCGLFALAAWSPVSAQTKQSADYPTGRSHLGPRVSFNFDFDEVAIGAQFSTPIARRLEFYPSFDYYFVDPGSLWTLNADLKYRVSANRSADWLYLGGGLGFSRIDVGPAEDTDVGLNLLAGVEPLRGRVHPFAEGRLTLGDGSTFQISGGLNFTLGRH